MFVVCLDGAGNECTEFECVGFVVGGVVDLGSDCVRFIGGDVDFGPSREFEVHVQRSESESLKFGAGEKGGPVVDHCVGSWWVSSHVGAGRGGGIDVVGENQGGVSDFQPLVVGVVEQLRPHFRRKMGVYISGC